MFSLCCSIAKSAVTVVPDFHNSSTNAPLASLKSRIDSMGAKPLGLIRCDASEILVVFNGRPTNLLALATALTLAENSDGLLHYEARRSC